MWEHNGKVYARVSDIIKPFVDFGGIDEEVLNRKAVIGTRVHKAIDEEIRGDLPILTGKEIGYFQSFNKWRHAVNVKFLETEKRYYCDTKRITGCVDCLVEFQGENVAVLVDFKTSAQESPVTWPMQAHLYYYLATASGKKLAPRFLFIKLDRFGDLPKVFQYKFDNNLMNRCLQAIDSYWEKQSVALNVS